MAFIWQSLILVAGGFLLLRLGGRKSISQMSVAKTIVMISIGAIIVALLATKGITRTLTAAAVFVLFLVIVEFLELKFNFIEKIITGEAIVVIQDGKPVYENLRRLRISIEDLEMRLRQKGIAHVSDLKTGTIEANGVLGFEWMPHARPVTMGDLEKFLKMTNPSQNVFTEVVQKHNDQHIPKQLQ